MNTQEFHRARRRSLLVVLAALVMCASFSTESVLAVSWNGIEPFKAKRADVERILGAPIRDDLEKNATLQFKLQGGSITVAFVTAKFVVSKKLMAEYEGTVLQIIVQHNNSPETPKSLGIDRNADFDVESRGLLSIYRNSKDGIHYTFIGGKLKTTRYAPSSEQTSRAKTK